jgi:hypothetical protein
MAWADAAAISQKSKKSRISQKPHILHFTNVDASVTISTLIFEAWVFFPFFPFLLALKANSPARQRWAASKERG